MAFGDVAFQMCEKCECTSQKHMAPCKHADQKEHERETHKFEFSRVRMSKVVQLPCRPLPCRHVPKSHARRFPDIGPGL